MPKEHPSYEVTCTYEFLEDTFAEWGPTRIYDSTQLKSQYHFYGLQGGNYRNAEPMISKIGEKLILPGYAKKQSEIKRNHPLKYMVSIF